MIGVSLMNDQSIACGCCGHELFANGESTFICPFCGAKVDVNPHKPESVEAKLSRLERELKRTKVKAEIEEEAVNDMFWRNPLGLFAGLDRQQARQALEVGDVETARRHLDDAKRTSGVGFVLNVIIAIVLAIVILSIVR